MGNVGSDLRSNKKVLLRCWGKKQQWVPLLLFSVSSPQGNNCCLLKKKKISWSSFAQCLRWPLRGLLPVPCQAQLLPPPLPSPASASHASPCLSSLSLPFFSLPFVHALQWQSPGCCRRGIWEPPGPQCCSGFLCWLPVHWSPLPLEVGQNKGETFPLASPPHSDISFPCLLPSAWQGALLLRMGFGQ